MACEIVSNGQLPGGADRICFVRLTEVSPALIDRHMSEPRVTVHLPLLTEAWDSRATETFIADKEAQWQRHGLGHWAILVEGCYAGWGGFQKEGEDWDRGLVLTPEYFGFGRKVTAKMLDFARSDPRIPYVTFLLPASRTKLGALFRMGARRVGQVDLDNTRFLKFRLETA